LVYPETLTGCNVEESNGTKTAMTALNIDTTCRFALDNLRGAGVDHTGNFEVLANCTLFEMAFGGCKLKLNPGPTHAKVEYGTISEAGRGETEVTFGVTNLSMTKENCANISGTEATYTGKMYLPELIIAP
jgi:hypothetical protein